MAGLPSKQLERPAGIAVSGELALRGKEASVAAYGLSGAPT